MHALQVLPATRLDRSHLLDRVWGALVGVLIAAAVLQASSGFAADTKTREIQRLLWALGYGIARLDGMPSSELRERSASFLADRGKEGILRDDDLLTELNAAYREKRLAAEGAATSSEVIDRRGLTETFSDDVRLVVSREDDLVLAGDCKRINRYRLSNSAPLTEFDGTCNGGSFVLSRSLGLIANPARWNSDADGLILYDARTGLRTDFIEIPDKVSLFSKLDISPNGKDVVVLSPANAWHVDLQTRAVTKLFGGLSQIATNGVRFSPDGRTVALAWFKNKENFLQLWDLAAGRRMSEYRARDAVFSGDGKLFALYNPDGTLEIRETSTGRVLFRRKFDSHSPDFDRGVPSFSPDAAGILYLDYDAHLYEWRFDSGIDRERFRLASAPDRALIDAKAGKLYAIIKSRVVTYDLKDGTALVDSGRLDAFSPVAAAVSPDKKLVALQSADAITLVDAATGQARALSFPKLADMTAIAFLPDSTRVLIGGKAGRLVVANVKTGAFQELASVGKGDVKAVSTARAGTLAAVVTNEETAKGQLLVVDLSNGRVLARTPLNPFEATSQSVAFVDDDRRLMFPDQYRAVVLDIASGRRILDQELRSNVKTEGRQTTWMHAWIGFVIPKGQGSGGYWVGGKSVGSDILYEYANGSFTTRVGRPEGTTSFFPAGAEAAATADDGALELIMYPKVPKVSRIDADKFASEHLPLRDKPLAISSLAGDRFLTVDESGEVRIYSRSQRAPLVRTLIYADGNWLSRTASGFFAGTREATDNLFLTLGTLDSKPLESFFDALYRPDLVREMIGGDLEGKVKKAAASLDLPRIIASGPAPKVTIVSPAAGLASATDEIAVEAELLDQGGGIGKIEWRINGVTQGVDVRGLARLDTPSSSTSTRVSRTLVLDRGESRIEILAYNAKDLIASEPAKVTVKWDGEKTASLPKLYVLAVGVNDYWDGRLQLAFAVPDAQAVGDALRRAGDNLYESVEVTTVLDADVTAGNLDRVFTSLGARIRPRDVFIYFMAGHGRTIDGRFYFIPQDFRYAGEESFAARGLGQDQLQQWLARIQARKSVLLFDACESGSLTEDGSARRGMEQITALDRLTHAMGRTVLTATTDDKPAAEGIGGHGVFTYALLKGLAEAPTDSAGLVEVAELASYVDRTVPDLSYQAFHIRQVPQMKLVGSNFPIAHRIALASEPTPVVAAAKPTHVVIAATEVHQSASPSGPVVMELPAGAQVTLIEAADGWAAVAREGRRLGYVKQSALVRLQ